MVCYSERNRIECARLKRRAIQQTNSFTMCFLNSLHYNLRYVLVFGVVLSIFFLVYNIFFARIFIEYNFNDGKGQLSNVNVNSKSANQHVMVNLEKKYSDQSVISRTFFEYLSSQLYGTPFSGVDNYIQYVREYSKLETLSNVIPLREDYGLVINDVTSFIYPIEVKTYRNIAGLFVAVISAPENFEERTSIRQTWLDHLQTQAKIGLLSLAGFAFVVGLTTDKTTQKRIEGENKMHRDILQIDMIDNSYNLPVKTIGLINWLNNHCSHVSFVLKVDDNVYVNVHNLAATLATLDPDENIIYGSKADDKPVQEFESK